MFSSRTRAESRRGARRSPPGPTRPFQAVIFDFDGVLTDNRVYIFENGSEAVCCNRADGLAFDMLRRAGIPALIVSTEANPVVAARAAKLKVPVIQNVSDKAAVVADYCAQANLSPDNVAYVGNDVNDLGAMGSVGCALCPSDAHPLVKAIADHILLTPGGAGVAREIAERLLGLGYQPPVPP